MFIKNGYDPAREDNYRLQGVQLIENVREHLKLYIILTKQSPQKRRLTTNMLCSDPFEPSTLPAHTTTSSASTSATPSTTTKTQR